jgi:hypothetical protein
METTRITIELPAEASGDFQAFLLRHPEVVVLEPEFDAAFIQSLIDAKARVDGGEYYSEEEVFEILEKEWQT